MSHRVLVTGAGGLIGRSTVERLLCEGFAVTALSPDPPGRWSGAVRTVLADAADEHAVGQAAEGCDAVVHLAALAHPSLGSPRRVFTNNVVSTYTVLTAAAERGIDRIVVASSIQASGIGLSPHKPSPAYFPLDEALPAQIADAYSLSKRLDELSADMVARTWGTTVVALRFPLVNTIERLRALSAEVGRDPISMMRTGWAYLTVDDAARAVLCALRAPLSGAHVVGLSAADTLLVRPTEELLAEYAPEVPVRRRFVANEALVDTTAARLLLDFQPAQSVHTP